MPPGLVVNAANTCNAGGLLDSTTSARTTLPRTSSKKFALDPGWGHYEAFGIAALVHRRRSVDWPALPARRCRIPRLSWSQKTNFGWGVGGNVLMPVWPKFVDLQGSVLYGQGIGRYGSSQLADVTIGPDGTLQAACDHSGPAGRGRSSVGLGSTSMATLARSR